MWAQRTCVQASLQRSTYGGRGKVRRRQFVGLFLGKNGPDRPFHEALAKKEERERTRANSGGEGGSAGPVGLPLPPSEIHGQTDAWRLAASHDTCECIHKAITKAIIPQAILSKFSTSPNGEKSEDLKVQRHEKVFLKRNLQGGSPCPCPCPCPCSFLTVCYID